MRKVKSAPQLAGMDGSCGSLRVRTSSSTALYKGDAPNSPVLRREARATTIGAKRQQLGGRSSIACHAFLLSTPENHPMNVLNSADEMLVEASLAKGIAGAECFELFGYEPTSAPPLDGKQMFSKALKMENEGLATCLASPIMPEDKSLGEIVQSAFKKALIETEMSVQARYVEEVKKATEEDQVDGILGRHDRRRKRRASEEHFDNLMEAHLAINGGSIIKSPILSSSPETKGLLSTLSVWEDTSANRLTVDENEFCNPETSFCCEEPDECLFSLEAEESMDLGSNKLCTPAET